MPLPQRNYDRTLNAELERIQYEMKVANEEFEGLLNGINEEQAQWSPGVGWSIAQNIDHLNLTNHKLIGSFEAAIRRGRAENQLGNGPYAYSWLSRYFFRQTQPPIKRKFKAPKDFAPGAGKGLGELRAKWVTTHERLRELTVEANGLDLAKIKVASPVTRLIKFDLGMAFWIQTAHDRRHLAQARGVRNDSRFPR